MWVALAPALLLVSLALPWPWLPAWLGRLHPMVLHFPIAFLLIAALLEFLPRAARDRWSETAALLLLLGSTGAVAAAACGYLLMWGDRVEGDLMERHFMSGLAVAVLSVVALALRLAPEWEVLPRLRRIYRGVLALLCVVLVLASHAGASLTHGEGYLMEHLPWVDRQAPVTLPENLAAGEWQVYNHVVAPILATRCYECHRGSNFKGKLVLDRWDGLVRGGASGALFVTGQPNDSLVMTRLRLPLSHDDHMPPRRKPQPSETEIALLHRWIEAGAPSEGTLASLDADTAWLDLVRALPAALRSGEMADVAPAVALDEGAVTALRADAATAFDVLQQRFPGVLSYASRQSADVEVNAAPLGSAFGDAELAAFAPLGPHIVRLDLSRTGVSDRGMTTLTSMPNLRVLRLNETAITDEGVRQLRALTSLESLSLFRTEITDASLGHIAALPNLRHWTVAETGVTAE